MLLRNDGNYQGYADVVFGTGQILGGSVCRLWIETMAEVFMFAIQVLIVMFCSFLTHMNAKIRLYHVPLISKGFVFGKLSRTDIMGSSSLVMAICGILFEYTTNRNKIYFSLLPLFDSYPLL